MPLGEKLTEEQRRKIKKQINDTYEFYFPFLPYRDALVYKKLRKGLSKCKKGVMRESYFFFRNIYDNYGFINPDKYGIELTIKYWVFGYYMSSSIGLQLKKKYLFEFQKYLPKNSILRPLYAIMYDKVRMKEGKKQRYGTNEAHFKENGVEDFKNLKNFRETMNLV